MISQPVNNEIKLFANLCIREGILNVTECEKLAPKLTPQSDLLEFAQGILEDGRDEHFDAIQTILGETEELIESNTIAQSNPFQNPPSATPAQKTPTEPQVLETTTVPHNTRIISIDGVSPAWFEPDSLEGISSQEAQGVLTSLLLIATQEGASDLHVSAGSRIFIRGQREIIYKSKSILSPEMARLLNLSMLSKDQSAEFKATQDYDFALPFSSGQRFRVNLMEHKDGLAGTYRVIPLKSNTLETLGFTNADKIEGLLAHHNGLILVTGPVGSGKTTTLAALIEVLNQTRQDHIITVEEPIEVIQPSNECQITQRGVGPHTESFKRALKGALRQDPDIIVIGEMRDLETIEIAISASETGHLVIGTMHTSDAATTLNRLLDAFPPSQQPQIRAMVSESLRGIICQRLLPNKSGQLSLACELLLQNLAVSALIREGKTQSLGNVMETGRSAGMIQMDQSILDLWQNGQISDEVALGNIKNKMLHTRIQR